MPADFPTQMLRDIRHALAPRPLPARMAPDAAATLPATPGTYLLLLRLDAPLPLRGRFTGETLPSGHYAYAGSARGPGGLRARLWRHLRREKAIRWHIDQLTTRAMALAALPFPDDDFLKGHGARLTECALAAALLRAGSFAIPLPGFGSSDCPTCPAHLLRWTGPAAHTPSPLVGKGRGGGSA